MKRISCPISYKCGSCDFMDIRYDEELRWKDEKVYRLFRHWCPVYDTIGMEDPVRWRDKVHATFGYDRDGHVISGLYKRGTHRLTPVRDCMLEFEEAGHILSSIRQLMGKFLIQPYDEDSHKGNLRHCLMRKGHKSGEILVCLIFGSDRFKKKRELAEELKELCPEITTVCYQINGDDTSMVLNDSPIHKLIGEGFIHDRLFDLDVTISPSSFYQVNAVQTEVLYKMAMKMAHLRGGERVLDAYSGTGTIGLVAARKAGSVVSVELNPDACQNAVDNAERNGITNIEIINADASSYCKEMAKQKETFDCVFLDPPRAGSDERFLAAMMKMEPERVVYISCNPSTQLRDIRYMEKFGPYRVTAVQPVDLFPRCDHIETVALIERIREDERY